MGSFRPVVTMDEGMEGPEVRRVEMSSFLSPPHLQSSPSIPVPILGPIHFWITISIFHRSWVIIIQVSGQEDGISRCQILLKRQKELNPKEAGGARDGGECS